MDWNRVEGNWKQTKGKIKEKWGQLTDDDLTQINGKRDQLEGNIEQRYGLAKDMVRKDVDDWLKAQNPVLPRPRAACAIGAATGTGHRPVPAPFWGTRFAAHSFSAKQQHREQQRENVHELFSGPPRDSA